MRVNPADNSLTYSIGNLRSVETALSEIEKEVLDSDSVPVDIARSICSELNLIRDSLSLKIGVRRHDKFSSTIR